MCKMKNTVAESLTFDIWEKSVQLASETRKIIVPQQGPSTAVP